MTVSDWIVPDWQAPARVRALMTTRHGGVSRPPYDELNLGAHVGDDPAAVAANRARVRARVGSEPLWLEQVHGTDVVDAAEAVGQGVPRADAALARRPGVVCAVMTADCLPVLFCDDDGTVVAAAHAGWRGLCAGVLERTVERMAVAPSSIQAWLGPAIGPTAFEVGGEVREAFLGHDTAAGSAFVRAGAPGKWLADLYGLARQRLAGAGVTRIGGGEYCTWSDSARFFSYRRDGTTGRMAALIWLQE
ncbi:peptidoglycan editing factor PgeF [Pseudothauera rhizosphaerae]|uniref:Purine nucleoside phosphorylase n=1 Tax=Pseudothauera rhizosphaerae TaxID=2565932 RepID=A0A4S4ARQ1_9RHOO|nr:peptidoglycan editing factor PgeF [Pseudothauera rhizosphaerae]THF62455.1 peptidoglycan editing factor PgeF [Pseudothauera rhizosphaerae]